LFRFFAETESFGVSIEPKQTEDQPKQFDREHILQFFTENFGVVHFYGFFICFGFFRLVSKQFGSIEQKQTETHPNSLKRVYLGIFQKI
jgi:hypothetical protein